LFWLLEQYVDKGSTLSRLGFETGLDKLLNLVVRNFNVHDLFLSFWTFKPENVFGSERNGVWIDSFTNKLETSRRNFLTSAFYLEISSLTTPTSGAESTSKGLRSEGRLSKGCGRALEF
jgi:hypothetical protein